MSCGKDGCETRISRLASWGLYHCTMAAENDYGLGDSQCLYQCSRSVQKRALKAAFSRRTVAPTQQWALAAMLCIDRQCFARKSFSQF